MGLINVLWHVGNFADCAFIGSIVCLANSICYVSVVVYYTSLSENSTLHNPYRLISQEGPDLIPEIVHDGGMTNSHLEYHRTMSTPEPVERIVNDLLEAEITTETFDWRREINYSLRHIFPLLYEWPLLKSTEKIFGIITMPIVFVLNTTVPVIHEHHLDTIVETHISRLGDIVLETEQELEHDYPKLLLFTQLMLAPAVIFTLYGILYTRFLGYLLLCWAFPAGLVLAFVGYIVTKDKPVISHTATITFIGFLISLFYIMSVTDRLVSTIAELGELFGIADSVLGISLFAFGNSLPDIISNLSLAKRGSGTMALAACIGGPALSIIF